MKARHSSVCQCIENLGYTADRRDVQADFRVAESVEGVRPGRALARGALGCNNDWAALRRPRAHRDPRLAD
jgi:hypothetical protein